MFETLKAITVLPLWRKKGNNIVHKFYRYITANLGLPVQFTVSVVLRVTS